ncbi:MAG: hypothetical protein JJU15_03060 [Pararhodobacter sp.]|nr:hypothetical protein [Pararhodobacter sp.]
MKHFLSTCAALLVALPASTALQASEAGFLQQFSGDWTGGGQVRMSPDSSPVNVSCEFDGQSGESSAVLDGSCTGMIFFTRQLGAQIAVENGTYVGSYVGSPRGTAALEGEREGNALDLAMQWPGHPPASMTLANPAEGHMVLTTVETHPETGEAVVTAELELQRQ